MKNTEAAIVGLLDKVRLSTLEHFTVLDTYIYDEGLDFRGRASQFITREGIFQQLEGKPSNDWVFIIWNRSSLQNSNYNNRPIEISANFEDPDGPNRANSTANMRMASLDIEFKIVTNNMSIAESIEEHLYVNTGEFLVYEADYGDLGIFTLGAMPGTNTSFEKEDLGENGPVIGIGLTVNIEFPVIMPFNMSSVIETINYKLWQYPLDNPTLMEEEIIS